MKNLIFIFLLFTSMALTAQQAIEIPIWPNGSTETNGITEMETTNADGHISNITTASFKVYPADKAKNTGAAVLICPGGGYGIEAANHEGVRFAEWYAEKGITGIVLKYRLPNGHHEIPLKDTQEAMRIIRKRAAEWGIDPNKIGISGFSAGGHLASTLLTHFDALSRPDFGILFYPVISLEGEKNPHIGSRKNLMGEDEKKQELIHYYSSERQIKDNTPPTLLLLSDDDKAVVPENSILFYQGLKAKNIPASLYIFPEGGHGWGFHPGFRYHEQMKTLILDWLAERKIL